MPTIDFTVASNGITVYSDKFLKMPRFVPFDFAGKCQLCKSDAIDLDYVIQPHGCIIYCNRMKRERFVPFDYATKLEEGCTFFRVKTRGRSMNIPYEKEVNVASLNNVNQSARLSMEVEKQQVVETISEENKKKKEGESEEIVFVESIKRSKNEETLQTETNEKELQTPSVAIVVIDDVPEKLKEREISSGTHMVEGRDNSEQMDVDKKNDVVGEEEKKKGEVEIIREQIVA